jgi:Leucine-rich repeat (LRR) protein
MSKKILQEKFPGATVKRILFKDHNFMVTLKDTTHHIKILNVNRSTILSINSKHIWEIKNGKTKGISFKESSRKLIDMKPFNKRSNRIIVFKKQPYKILKYINESEVVDISNTEDIFNIKIYNSFKEIIV